MRLEVRATLTCRCKCALLIPSPLTWKNTCLICTCKHTCCYQKRRTSNVHLLCLWYRPFPRALNLAESVCCMEACLDELQACAGPWAAVWRPESLQQFTGNLRLLPLMRRSFLPCSPPPPPWCRGCRSGRRSGRRRCRHRRWPPWSVPL